MAKKYQLSKSTFLRGLKCEKSLYLYKHHYDTKDDVSNAQQAIFDQGNEAGILAQQLFPNGVDVSPEDHRYMADSAPKTLELIRQGETVIYEATFIYDEVLVALDILVKDEEGWKAYEVKSSTSVKDTHIHDAAIQFYTLSHAGIDLKDISIVHINSDYVRNGPVDINELFTIQSVYDDIQSLLPNIPSQLSRLKSVIAQVNIPEVAIGSQCTSPYTCDFKGTCWKDVPEYSVFDLVNLRSNKKFAFYDQGILSLEEVSKHRDQLNDRQVRQIEAELTQETLIDKDNIRAFIDDLTYPLYYLDFETINPSIPLYDGSRPYQASVFQYSLHKQASATAEVEHMDFLGDPAEDPRLAFAEQMIRDCGDSGDILVYNISFERGKIMDLAELLPNHKDALQRIADRLKDLMVPFKEQWYYAPEMRGSYSIKAVLPALISELSYQDLDIKDGGIASSTFLSMVKGSFEGNIEETRQHLIEYCKLDTWAMVKILEKLREV